MLSPLQKRSYLTLSEWVEGPTKLKPNKSIELDDGDFIRIKSIHKDLETTEVFLRGWRFRRLSDMNGILKKAMNEVCLVVDLTEGDKVTDNKRFRTGDIVESCRQGLEDVPLNKYKKVRKLVLTNMRFPDCSFRASNDRLLPKSQIYHEAVLVCRVKHVVFYKRGKFRMPDAWSEKAVMWLNSSEADPTSNITDEELHQAWRGLTTRGGSRAGFLDGEVEFDREERSAIRARKDTRFLGVAPPPHSGPGTRPSSPIYLDPGSPIERKQKRGVGVRPRAKLLPFTISESKDNAQETASPNPISVHLQSATLADRPVKRHRPGRGLSPEPFSTTTFFSTPRRIRAPVTPPSTPVNQIAQGRKRTLREDNVVIDLLARPPTPDTQSTPIRRHPFTKLVTFRSLNPFTPPSDTQASRESKQVRRYTFGDAFCGAGGTSRGAKMAGLRVEWGFDFAVNPITSYQSNFFGAHAYHASVDLFTQLQDEDHQVDILHLSPPCQPFSAAHTVPGKDDDMNEATFLGIAAIIKKAKPRVVTLEQTSGLIHRRDFWFTAMIHMIVDLGFSVRWKMLNMADYGLAQGRRRLILIASW
jgi:DNA (cytosine-5)-methyltransferase 1